jgi:F-box protein 28
MEISSFSAQWALKIRTTCSDSQVSRKFNYLCGQILNAGIKRADELKTKERKRLKDRMPRRESERRVHPLSRHVHVFTSLENRSTLLQLTYKHYMDAGLCPFVPGKVSPTPRSCSRHD